MPSQSDSSESPESSDESLDFASSSLFPPEGFVDVDPLSPAWNQGGVFLPSSSSSMGEKMLRKNVDWFHGYEYISLLESSRAGGVGASLSNGSYASTVIVFVSISRQIGHVNSVERIFVFITMRRPWTRGTTLRKYAYPVIVGEDEFTVVLCLSVTV
uniref:Uncharacterized protein n=1 Tax=Pristionchus pacificus TaxID=54126 RepID=A0A2A6CGM2_PRIPA|eukprot:PDM77362.1 hypothetical protein PRIPAC_33092 [Pristionchus pacificus]